MKIIWKILEGLIIVLLIITLFVTACFAYSKYVKKDIVANAFGYAYLVVQTNSMIPEFEAGDKLIIKLNSNYEVGDIVTYKEDNVFVTHRVIEIKNNTIITKGDANNTDDGEIEKSNVIGVVKKIIK